MASEERAKLAYDTFRGGFRPGVFVPPHWDGLKDWMRDAMTVAYLQGKLDQPGWLPIETAPKDGTFMWLSNGFLMRLGYWNVVTKDPTRERWVDMARAEARGACDLMFVPTLWRPTPESPATNKMPGADA